MLRAAAPCLLACAIALTGCSDDPGTETTETQVVDSASVAAEAENEPVQAELATEAARGTPMEDRVATIGLINKRNNVTQDLEMRPGESREVGPVIVRLQACERTPPWEMPQEEGAFVQVDVQNRGEEDYSRVFSGWLFKNSPSVNVVEHPIYDVWVKSCAMSFPGEE